MSVEHLLHAMVEKLKLEPVLELGRLLGIGSLLQDLQTHFRMIHGRISRIDESAVLMINVNNEQYLQLLQRLWSLTLDTDDVLNRISRHLRKKGGIFSLHQVRSSPILRRLHFRRVNKIREALASLQNCHAQICRIRLPAKHTDIQEAMSCQRTCGESEGVLGRERELDDVLRMMQTDDSTPGLSILPITGMAGIGKTTLAQLVFWHPWVVDTFGDDRIWVSVPRNFSIMVIVSRIAQVLTAEQCSIRDSSETEMIEQDSVKLKWLVKKKLSGRRFFLVLDDAWDQSLQKWQELMEVLDSAGKPGSKMIVTSRIPDVVTLTKSLKPYTLQRLLPAHSSRLLTQWMQDPAELPPRLIPIRKMIAETCAGVPSLLLSASNKLKSIRKTQVAWQHVLSRFDLVFYADRLLLDAAYVSYQHLPSSIQQCFLYCSLLLVHSFTPEQLTDMFVADELIKLISSKSDMHLYFSKIMTEHFYDVVQKSRRRGNTVYKMHPGMQLLAQRISRGFHLAIDARKEIIWPSNDARCLSLLVDCETSKLPPELFELESLRTLILLRDENMLLSENKCAITDIPAEFCQRLTALRVLHMQSCRIKRIPRLIDMLQNLTYINLSHNDIEIVPDSVSNLRFLTHLNLSRNEIVELPESVGKIQSLQMLDLSHCEKLLGLHEAISNLVNLHTLNLEGCHYLAMNQLTSIKILPRYIAAETPKHTISELRPLVHLKELGVQNMENSSSADARNVILQDKHKLESLALSWTGNCTDPETSSRSQELLEHLKPSRGLKVLQLFSYPGRKLPSWITSGVPYLNSLTDIKLNDNCQCPKLTAVHVKLRAVTSLIMLMNNEKLIACRGSLQGLSRNLRSLSISLCEELLERSQCEGLHELHRLEELQISRCTELISYLVTLPEWLKNITSLRSLCISDCPKLHIPKSLNNLSHLQIILE
nr:NBS-LRR disease resistance protein [Dasypyrum villosum]